MPASAERAEIDLDRLDGLLADGAQTLILTQPHNPWGRVFTRAELEGIRDVVVRHGARVVSDEIHAPSCCRAPSTSPTSRSTAPTTTRSRWSRRRRRSTPPACKCAQLVVPSAADRERLDAEPMSRNDSWSPLGVVAARAAYDHGDGVARVAGRAPRPAAPLLGVLLAEHLPEVRMRPIEATYLAWLDASAYGHDDAAAVALERGRVMVSDGASYAPGSTGHVRLNIATSPERLTEIVERLAKAWT